MTLPDGTTEKASPTQPHAFCASHAASRRTGLLAAGSVRVAAAVVPVHTLPPICSVNGFLSTPFLSPSIPKGLNSNPTSLSQTINRLNNVIKLCAQLTMTDR